MTKHLRLTLIRPGRAQLAATVTLTSTATPRVELWAGVASVEIDGVPVKHGTAGHHSERDALRVLSEWMLLRFDASFTLLETGSRMTPVAVEPPVLSCVVGTSSTGKLDPTVLVVDDDEQVRSVIRRMLRDTGWRIVEAGSAVEALARCAEHRDRIEVVLIDVIMPDLDGCRLVARMRETSPALRAIYMSGYGAEILSTYGASPDETAFLQKPFTGAGLRGRLRSTLGADDRLSP